MDANDSGEEEEEGSWKEGGVASGSVENRIPVDTRIHLTQYATSKWNKRKNTYILHFSLLH